MNKIVETLALPGSLDFPPTIYCVALINDVRIMNMVVQARTYPKAMTVQRLGEPPVIKTMTYPKNHAIRCYGFNGVYVGCHSVTRIRYYLGKLGFNVAENFNEIVRRAGW